MLKALFKKQFLEMGYFYLKGPRAGKKRSKGTYIFFLILCIVGYIAGCALFAGIATVLAGVFVHSPFPWMLYAVMGIMALFLGVMGSIFSTYTGLYHARDNEFLMSMPIPPSRLLLVRLSTIFVMSLLSESMVMLPTFAAMWRIKPPSAMEVIIQIKAVILLGLMVLSLTCALGWVVAAISSRLKNRNIVTVLLSLTGLALYYWFSFKLNEFVQQLALNADRLSQAIKGAGYPLYAFAMAAGGSVTHLAVFALMAVLLTGLTCYLLSRSFIKIVSTDRGRKKSVYRERTVKAAGASAALLRKEFMKLGSSSTYMLNCGMGLVFMPAMTVFAFLQRSQLRNFLSTLFLGIGMEKGTVPAALAGIMCVLVSFGFFTAPSVSLEGKNIWLVQSLPVKAGDVLRAKQGMALLLNLPVSGLCTAALGFIAEIGAACTALAVFCVFAFAFLYSALGLVLNLLKPNLSWTTEAAPIKQSVPTLICSFGGLLLGAGMVWGYYRFGTAAGPEIFLSAVSAVFLLAALILNRWLDTRGAAIFEHL